ncbi:hypothetical protein LguiA_008211 [Lonicera macranthoides]
MYQEESAVLFPSSLDELNDFVNNSLLGKLVLMLWYYFTSSEVPMKLKKWLKLFYSICPFSGPNDDLLDCEFSEIDVVSLSEIDSEIYNLMHEIESNKELESGKIVELDYLWGNAAINIRRERELEKDMDCSLVLNANKK